MVNRNVSWFSLFSFCFTGALLAALAFAILVTTATLALASGQSTDSRDLSSSKTFAGVITDSYCGAKHSTASQMSPSECTRYCVRHGAKYMLVNGGTAYTLAGNEDALDKLAGERARIQGALEGETLQVSSVEAQ